MHSTYMEKSCCCVLQYDAQAHVFYNNLYGIYACNSMYGHGLLFYYREHVIHALDVNSS